MDYRPCPDVASCGHDEWDDADIEAKFFARASADESDDSNIGAGLFPRAAGDEWDGNDVEAEVLARAEEDERREAYIQANIKCAAEKFGKFVELNMELKMNTRIQRWQGPLAFRLQKAPKSSHGARCYLDHSRIRIWPGEHRIKVSPSRCWKDFGWGNYTHSFLSWPGLR